MPREPNYLGDGGDAVFGGVDVGLVSGSWVIDDLDEEGKRLADGINVRLSTTLRHDAHAIRRRLSHLHE